MLSVLSHCLPSLYRYAYRLLGNQADAEDAVQDALVAAFEHLNQFRGDAQLSTWLTTIVINCARMHLRSGHAISMYPWIRESEKSGSIRCPTLWWITGPIPRMSTTRLGRMRACRVSGKTIADFAEDVSPAVCGSSFSLAKQLAFWEFPSER